MNIFKKLVATKPALAEEPEAETRAEPALAEEPEAETRAEPALAEEPEAKTRAEPALAEEPEAETRAEPTLAEEPEAETRAEPALAEESEDKQALNLYEKLESIENGVLGFSELLNKFGKFLDNKEKNNQKYYEDIIDSFLKLQESATGKDDEISRLKKGYDNKIKKKFTSGLLSLRDRIEYYIIEETSSEDLVKACNGMLAILDNTLMEEDILSFGYESGTSIRDIEDFEILEKVSTSDEEKIGRVIKTIKHGYFLKGLDQSKIIIRKASIECYVEE